MSKGDVACLSLKALESILDGKWNSDSRCAWEEHIAACESCRKRLDQLGATETMVSIHLDEIANGETSPPKSPELDSAIDRLKTHAFNLAGEAAGNGSTTDSTPDILEPTEDEGSLGTLGGFEVIEQIAEGGMGLVFRARDPKLQREVAIKVLSPTLAADPSAREMFLNEARAVAALEHENVLPIHLVETADDLPYLVMPMVRGGTLQDRLGDSPPLDFENDILPIALASARALAAAHDAGIIHRDIKPANLMLETGAGRKLRCWLADFGLARAIQIPPVPLEKPGTVSGTPHFMAPEILEGAEPGPSSDLFSLGCVFYAMTAGSPPFQGETASEVIHQVRTCDPPPPADRQSPVPDWFISLTGSLLEKDPAKRPDTAADLVEKIERHSRAARDQKIRAPLVRRIRRAAGFTMILVLAIAGVLSICDLTGQTRWANALLANFNGRAFSIRGEWGVFETLETTVSRAASGATIEILRDVSHSIDSLNLADKELTIRALSGKEVILAADSGRTLFTSQAPLALENLVLRQPKTGKQLPPPLIVANGAPLRIVRCRIQSDAGNNIRPRGPRANYHRPPIILLDDAGSLSISDSILVGKFSTAILARSSRPDPSPLQIRVRNSLVVSHYLFYVRHDDASIIDLANTTVVSNTTFVFDPPSPDQGTTVSLEGTAIESADNLVWFVPGRLDGISAVIGWAQSGTVLCPREGRFINLNPPVVGPATASPGTPGTLDEFIDLLRIEGTGSHEFPLLMSPETAGLIGTSGPFLSPLDIAFDESVAAFFDRVPGADLDSIGPR